MTPWLWFQLVVSLPAPGPVHDAVFTYHNRSHPVIRKLTGGRINGYGTSIDPDFFPETLLLVRAHLDWVRNMYIVVDYEDEIQIALPPRTYVVSTKQLYPAWALQKWPYFSPFPKEAYMHRIPTLSDSFLYINDDMLVVKPVRRSFFFPADGRLRMLVGPEFKANPWWTFFSDIGRVGTRPSTRYTANCVFKNQSALRTALGSMALYASHAPRPYYKPAILYFERTFSEMFSSVFSTKGRCKHCLNPNVLMVAWSLMHPSKMTTVPAVDYAAQVSFPTQQRLTQAIFEYPFVTVQVSSDSKVRIIKRWTSSVVTGV